MRGNVHYLKKPYMGLKNMDAPSWALGGSQCILGRILMMARKEQEPIRDWNTVPLQELLPQII